jgi:hypothetical protein
MFGVFLDGERHFDVSKIKILYNKEIYLGKKLGV